MAPCGPDDTIKVSAFSFTDCDDQLLRPCVVILLEWRHHAILDGAGISPELEDVHLEAIKTVGQVLDHRYFQEGCTII